MPTGISTQTTPCAPMETHSPAQGDCDHWWTTEWVKDREGRQEIKDGKIEFRKNRWPRGIQEEDAGEDIKQIEKLKLCDRV